MGVVIEVGFYKVLNKCRFRSWLARGFIESGNIKFLSSMTFFGSRVGRRIQSNSTSVFTCIIGGMVRLWVISCHNEVCGGGVSQ